jgi:hypothetical protein
MSGELEPGEYRHYKGNLYVVLFVATHSETEEPLVVYYAKEKPERKWVRPLAMFRDTVNGVPRFARITDG